MTSQAPKVRRAYVDSGGMQIHYREIGSGDMPIVLLHQSASSSVGYVELMELLADDYRVIAPDTPGFGGSDPLPGPLSVTALAEALTGALEALGVTSCWLYGHHTGASLAAQIAADHPSLVEKLVLSGPPHFDEAMRERIRSTVRPYSPEADGSHLASAWKRHLALAGGAGVDVAHRELVLAFTAFEPERVYGAVLEMDVDEVFRRIVAPTLIMGGELDSIRGGFERAQASIAGSELEIVPGAGIYIVDEMPHHVADRLRGWFTVNE